MNSSDDPSAPARGIALGLLLASCLGWLPFFALVYLAVRFGPLG